MRGTFDYLSFAIETIWQIEKAQVEQSPLVLTKAISEDDRLALARRFEKVRLGESCQIEFNLHFSSDHVKQVKVAAHPVVDDTGQVTSIVSLVEDVTEPAQYWEFLLEFSRKKNNVLQIVAHDLQGPLTIIKGVTSLLETASSQQNYQDLAAHLDLITRAYHDCHQLIS